MGTQSPPKKGHPQFSAHVYCGQTAVCIRIPLGTEVGLSLGDIALDGDPAPPPLKGHSPQFSIHDRCGAKRLDGLRCHLVGRGGRPRPRRLCVRWGMGPSSARKKGTAPTQFSAHVCCGQTAGWMKTPLSMEVNFGPGHTVYLAPPCEKGTAAPLISAHVYCGHGRPSQLLLSSCSPFFLISDIAVFVLKRDVKLQLTHSPFLRHGKLIVAVLST